MFLMIAAANFVNVVAPAGGVAGLAVFIEDARNRGLSTGRVTLSGLLYLLYEYAALFAALSGGFIVLRQRGQLNPAELAAAGFLVLLAASVGTMLLVGRRSTRLLGDLLAFLGRRTNRLLHRALHRDPLTVERAYVFASELGDGLASLRLNRKLALLPLVYTLINKLLLVMVLALSFLALGLDMDGGTVLAGFSVGHLFFYASPTPSGVGFVDSVLPVALSSLGVPFASAVLVALVYRAVSFWLPLGLGALAFRRIARDERPGARSITPVEPREETGQVLG
jgi:uncharacterized membrane protein YbhN (UPF0104 family)